MPFLPKRKARTMRFPRVPHLPQAFGTDNVHTHGHEGLDTGYSASAAMPEGNTSVAVVTTPICCIECRRPWLVDGERWRIKLLVEGSASEPVPYCPDCHEREFGDE